MKKLTWILITVVAIFLFIWGFVLSQEEPKTSTPVDTAKKEVTKPAAADTAKEVKEHAYVGVKKCKVCHNMKKWGKIYDKWAATKHAKAYANLSNEKSKAIAKDLKIKDPQKSEKCLVCHVTGYEASAKLKGEKYSMENGVSCETCHGPAGDYLASHKKKDNKKQAIADGLMKPTEEFCVKCHNKNSPVFKEFKFKEAIKLVEHYKPTAEELKKEESKEEKAEG